MTISDNPKQKHSILKSLVSLARRLSPDSALFALELLELLSRILPRFLKPSSPYEVLDYDVTLDLRDKRGRLAYYIKRKKIRILQDYIRAIDDYAWGDGNPVACYMAKPGALGPRTAVGSRYITPIVFPTERKKGDVVALDVRRQFHNTFFGRRGWLEAEVSHPTKRLRLHVIFPKARPCKSARVHGHYDQQPVLLGKRHISFLPSGRQKVTCEVKKPRLHETYTLQWAW